MYIGPGNGLMPGCAKPLFELFGLTIHEVLCFPSRGSFIRNSKWSVIKKGLKITHSREQPHLPGSTELTLIKRHTNIVCNLNLERNKSCDWKGSRTFVLMLNCCSIIWSTASTERQWELIACSTHFHLKYCHLNAMDHFNKFQVSI